MIPKEIKWFYQRGRRGFSDRDVWSFDYYLADVISKGCRQLFEISHGYPFDLTEEKWKAILDTLSNEFADYVKMKDNADSKEFNKKMTTLFALFRKHFSHLWD